jgi:excisionase family DNA binding protein
VSVEEIRHLLEDAQTALQVLAESTSQPAPTLRVEEPEADALETLSITQAQQLLHVSRSTVYALLNSGALAWTRVGKRRRILRTTILRYLQSNTQAS